MSKSPIHSPVHCQVSLLYSGYLTLIFRQKETLMNLFSCTVIAATLVGCGGQISTHITPSDPMQIPGTVIHLAEARMAQTASQKARISHLARGQNAYLGQLWIAPNAGVPLHRDPTEEYLYVLEGGGELTMNSVVYSLKKGTAVFMPAGAEVTFKNGAAPTVVLQIFAGPQSADKYQSWKNADKK